MSNKPHRPHQWHEFIIENNDEYHEVESFLQSYCLSEGCRFRVDGTGTSAILTDANLKDMLPKLWRMSRVRLRDVLTGICEEVWGSKLEDCCHEPAKYLGRDGNIYCREHIAAHL